MARAAQRGARGDVVPVQEVRAAVEAEGVGGLEEPRVDQDVVAPLGDRRVRVDLVDQPPQRRRGRPPRGAPTPRVERVAHEHAEDARRRRVEAQPPLVPRDLRRPPRRAAAARQPVRPTEERDRELEGAVAHHRGRVAGRCGVRRPCGGWRPAPPGDARCAASLSAASGTPPPCASSRRAATGTSTAARPPCAAATPPRRATRPTRGAGSAARRRGRRRRWRTRGATPTRRAAARRRTTPPTPRGPPSGSARRRRGR